MKSFRENSLHQGKNWQKFQDSLGIKTVNLKNILILVKKIPFGKSFLEIQRADLDRQIWEQIIQLAKKEKTIFCRIALNTDIMPNFLEKKACFLKNHRFPELSLMLDLEKNEEELLKDMNQTGRRHLKKAKKEGVVIEKSTNIDKFMEIFSETTKRDGFSGHQKNYYKKLLNIFENNAFMLLAKHEKEILAGGIFAYTEDTCIYLYGASSNQKRKLQAPTLLQWEAILEAKKAGKTIYDFFGIAPENQKNHPWQGVSQFKRKFGGIEIAYVPQFEIIFSKFWYFLFNLAKKIRKLI